MADRQQLPTQLSDAGIETRQETAIETRTGARSTCCGRTDIIVEVLSWLDRRWLRLTLGWTAVVVPALLVLVSFVAGGLSEAANVAQLVSLIPIGLGALYWAHSKRSSDNIIPSLDSDSAGNLHSGDVGPIPNEGVATNEESKLPRLHLAPFIAATAGLAVVVMLTLIGLFPRVIISPEKTAVAIVVGAHANAPTPHLTEAARTAALQAVVDGSEISLISNSSRPELISPDPENSNRCDRDCPAAVSNAEVDAINKRIQSARAKYPENNLLVALDLAARTIRSHNGPRVVIVIDSGLQSVSPLRFQDRLPLLDVAPDDVTEQLARGHLLPDLTGTKVLFTGLGDTADPQVPLTLPQRAALHSLWRAICVRSGGLPSFDDTPIGGSSRDSMPVVSTIAAPAPVDLNNIGLNDSATLLDSATTFKPDTASASDPAALTETLRPLAVKAIQLNARITITGTTSSVGPLESRIELSTRRAQVVANTLASLGVKRSQLNIIGAGSSGPGFTPDTDNNGNLIPELAARNRNVLIQLLPA